MSGCKAAGGLKATCEDKLRVGGADPDFWVGYLSELDTPFNLNRTSDITTIDFGSYGGLRKFEGQKFQHNFTVELAVGAGSNKSYTHTGVVKLLSDSTADDLIIEALNLGDDIFVIYQNNNDEFFITGAGNGLSSTAYSVSTGQTGDADTTDTVTLTGSERTKALRFKVGGTVAATLAYLKSFEL